MVRCNVLKAKTKKQKTKKNKQALCQDPLLTAETSLFLQDADRPLCHGHRDPAKRRQSKD